MKTLFVLLGLVLLGYTQASASVPDFPNLKKRVTVPSATSLAVMNIRMPGNVSLMYDPFFKCLVVLRFKSENVNVTMNFEGATCDEAWAAAKKVVDRFLK